MLKITKYFLYMLIIIGSVTSEKCVQKSCVCEFDDNRKIDLNPLSNGEFLRDQFTNSSLIYYFHPCSNKKLDLYNIDSKNNNCNETSMCIFNTTDKTTVNLGIVTDAEFTSNSDVYSLVYTHNNITTVVTLACLTNVAESYIKVTSSETSQHNLVLLSPAACIQNEHIVGLSTGSVLVILLLTFSTAYLIGGVAVLHFLRGARGREMIPNIDFWTDLPLLVRDGALFLQNGCKPVLPPADTYDRI